MHRLFAVLAVLALAGCVRQPAAAPPSVSLSKDTVLPGDVFTVTVMPGTRPVSGVQTWLAGHAPVFFPAGEARWALVGVNYRIAAGTYDLPVLVEHGGGRGLVFVRLQVEPRDFHTQLLRPTAQQASVLTNENIVRDRAKQVAARQNPSPAALWDGPLLQPAEGRLTTGYGWIRFIEGRGESSRHSGLDIAGPTGTRISAAAAGKVVLADGLHLGGNTVTIDHGLNLFTSYLHLHRISVKAGDMISRGQQVGTMGSTGFSTGPHLHWTVSIGGLPVDPFPLMEDEPPKPGK